MDSATYKSTEQYDSLSPAYGLDDGYFITDKYAQPRDAEFIPDARLDKPEYSISSSALGNSVADRVFGLQSRHAKLSLESITSALSERAMLHKRHMEEIEQRHLEIQGQHFGATLHSQLDNHKRAMTLQTTLLRLDDQRRQEELSYWKDTAELKTLLLESASEYGQAKQRITLLQNMEPLEDAYG